MKKMNEERKIIALMNKHEEIESYSSQLSLETERIILFYKLVASQVSNRRKNREGYSFWNELGSYIQQLRSPDDKLYGKQIPIMIEFLRKGMIQTY